MSTASEILTEIRERADAPQIMAYGFAHARTDVARLTDALEAVLALHSPKPDQFVEFEPHCAGCETVSTFTYYPCPTVTAITAALTPAEVEL